MLKLKILDYILLIACIATVTVVSINLYKQNNLSSVTELIIFVTLGLYAVNDITKS